MFPIQVLTCSNLDLAVVNKEPVSCIAVSCLLFPQTLIN